MGLCGVPDGESDLVDASGEILENNDASKMRIAQSWERP